MAQEVKMARILWPLGSVVCFKEYPDMEYTLTDRVNIGHTRIIALWNKEKFSIHWAFLDELQLVRRAAVAIKDHNFDYLSSSQEATTT